MLQHGKPVVSIGYKSINGNVVYHPLYGSVSEMKAKYKGPLPVRGKYGDRDCLYDLVDDSLEVIYDFTDLELPTVFYANRQLTFDDKFIDKPLYPVLEV